MKGEVTLKAGDKSYTFVLGTYGLAMLERETGQSTTKFFNRAEDDWGMADLLAVVKAGLIRHHPDVTEIDASDIIDSYGYEKIGQIIQEAVSLAFPEAEENARPPKPAEDGTGKTSAGTG